MPVWIGVLACIAWIAIQWYWASKKEDKERQEFEVKVDDNILIDSYIDTLYSFKTHRPNSMMKYGNLMTPTFLSDSVRLITNIINVQIAFPAYRFDENKALPYFIFIFDDYIKENIDLIHYEGNESSVEIQSFGEWFIKGIERNIKKKIFQKSPSNYFKKFSKIKEDNPDNYIEILDLQLDDFIKKTLDFNEHLTSNNDRSIVIAPRYDGIVNEITWIFTEILKGTTNQELGTYYTPFLENSDIIRFRGYPHGAINPD